MASARRGRKVAGLCGAEWVQLEGDTWVQRSPPGGEVGTYWEGAGATWLGSSISTAGLGSCALRRNAMGRELCSGKEAMQCGAVQ